MERTFVPPASAGRDAVLRKQNQVGLADSSESHRFGSEAQAWVILDGGLAPGSGADLFSGWGHSSVGRARALQARGHRFKPGCLHFQPAGRVGNTKFEKVVSDFGWGVLDFEFWASYFPSGACSSAG